MLTMCRILAVRDGILSRGTGDLALRRSQISRQENNPSYLREIEKCIIIEKYIPFQNRAAKMHWLNLKDC